jgi:hypothetical protein
MNDQPTPHSGSRWEPPPAPPGDQPGSQPAAAPRVRARPFAVRGRGAKVAVATVIVTLGGLGGFALGQAASDGGDQIGLVGSTTDDGRLPGSRPDPGDGLGPNPQGNDHDRVAPPELDDDGPGTPPDGFDDDSGAESGSDDTT